MGAGADAGADAAVFEARIAAASFLTESLLQLLVKRGVLERADVAMLVDCLRQAVEASLATTPGNTKGYQLEFANIISRIAAANNLPGAGTRQ